VQKDLADIQRTSIMPALVPPSGFTIQPTRSTHSSSTLTRLCSHPSLKFATRSTAIAVPPFCYKLPTSITTNI